MVIEPQPVLGQLADERMGTGLPQASASADVVDRVTGGVSWSRRIAYTVTITIVAVVAAWNSYWHMVSVALRGYQDPFLAYSLPFSVDGMLLVATLAIAEDKANRRRPRGWARFAFWLGASVSIAANVASVVVRHGLDALSIAVSAWPPVALLAVVEIMAKPGKPVTSLVERVPGVGVAVTAAPAEPPHHEPAVQAAAVVNPSSSRLGESIGGQGDVRATDVVAVAALIGPAFDAAAHLAGEGLAVSRDALSDRLRDTGYAVSNARASTLLKLIRAGGPARDDQESAVSS